MIAQRQESAPITQHKGLRQFIKFCIVGGSSTVVNFLFLNTLYFRLKMPLVPALTLAFIISVCNGFFWNRRWTFKEARHQAAHDQYWRFLIVNVVGWFLNTSIVVLIVAHFAAHNGAFGDWTAFRQIATAILTGAGKTQYSWQVVDGSQLAASMVVVFWNFFANRLWTFKH